MPPQTTETRRSIPTLGRLTTLYSATEDRVQIRAEVQGEGVMVIWFSQRLLNRVIPVLISWVQQQAEGLPRADLWQGFQQSRAQVQLLEAAAQGRNSPVDHASAGSEWMVQSVDVKHTDKHLFMVFKRQKDSLEGAVALPFQAAELRQWLNILFQAYRQGEWSLAVWPDWMPEPAGQPIPIIGPIH